MSDGVYIKFSADPSLVLAASNQASSAILQIGAAAKSASAAASSSIKEIAAEVAGMNATVGGATSSWTRYRQVMDEVGHASGSNRMAFMELGHSVRGVTDAMIAGASPTRAFAMEVPRLAQAFGELTPAMQASVWGFAGVAAGAIAAGAAFFGAYTYLTEFNAVADELSTKGLLAADSEEKWREGARNLRIEFGLASGDAKTLQADLMNLGGVPAQFAAKIQNMAVALQAQGVDFKDFAKAAAGGTGTLLKYAEASGLLNDAVREDGLTQKQYLQRLIDSGAETRAYNETLNTLADRFEKAGLAASKFDAAVKAFKPGEGAGFGPVFSIIETMTHARRRTEEQNQGAPPISAPQEELSSTLEHGEKFAGVDESVDKLKDHLTQLWAVWNSANQSGAGALDKLQAEISGVQRQIDTAGTTAGRRYFQEWKEQLDQQLIATNQHGEQLNGTELKFWTDRLAEAKAGGANYEGAIRMVEQQVWQLEEQRYRQSETAAKEETAAEKRAAEEKKRATEEWFREYSAGIQEMLAAAEGNSSAQASLMEDQLATAKRVFGEESVEYSKASEVIVKATEKAIQERERLAAQWAQGQSQLAQESLQAEVDGLDDEVASGQISADRKYSILRDLYARIHELRRNALEDEMADDGAGTDGALQAYNKLLALDQQYTNQVAQLDKQRAQKQEQTNQEIAQTAASSIMSMLEGQRNFTQIVTSLAEQLLQSQIEKLIELGLHWVENSVLKMGLDKAESASQTTTEATTAGLTAGITAASASQQINAAAGIAAANAFAATAAIPIVGPLLAPEAAAAAFAAVESFQIASAEGGWDRVPFDNAMTALHKNEMVLPARYADVIRQLGDSGSGMPGWGMPALPDRAAGLSGNASGFRGGDFAPNISHVVHIHGGPQGISNNDFQRAMKRNTGHAMDIMKNLYRNSGRRP